MWVLYKKDLLRLTKQPSGFILLIAMPIILATLLAFVFSNDQNGATVHVNLVIEDHDDSFVSGMIKNAFVQGELAKMFEVQYAEKGEGRAIVEGDKASALLIIPQGFSDSLFAVSSTELTIWKNPSQDFGPKIVEETVNILAEGGDRIVRIGEKPIKAIQKEMKNSEQMSDQSMAAIAVLINQLFRKAGDLVFNPPITLQEKSISENKPQSDSKTLFAVLLSGIATMCLYFIMNGLAVDYFREREQYTLYRILVTPERATSYLLSKQLYLFSAGLFSFVAVWLLAFTIWGLPVNPGQIIPFILLLLLITAAAVGIISLLYSLTRSRNQASAIAPAVIILFSLLGGGMIPIQSMPAFFKQLSFFSPIYWGVDGLQTVLIHDSPWGIGRHMIILAAIFVFCFLMSLFLQRRRMLI